MFSSYENFSLEWTTPFWPKFLFLFLQSANTTRWWQENHNDSDQQQRWCHFVCPDQSVKDYQKITSQDQTKIHFLVAKIRSDLFLNLGQVIHFSGSFFVQLLSTNRVTKEGVKMVQIFSLLNDLMHFRYKLCITSKIELHFLIILKFMIALAEFQFQQSASKGHSFIHSKINERTLVGSFLCSKARPHQNEEGSSTLLLLQWAEEFLLFPITPRWTNHFRDCLSLTFCLCQRLPKKRDLLTLQSKAVRLFFYFKPQPSWTPVSHLYPGVRFVKKLLFGVVTLLNSNNNGNRNYDIRASNCLLKVFF